MKQSKLWIGLLIITLGVMMLWQNRARIVSREVIYPIENISVWLKRTVVVRLKAVVSRADYAARNMRLERDLARLRIMLADNEAQESENARLRQLLGYTPPVTWRWVAASVISRGGTSAVWQTIRLGKGTLQGIRKGDLVMVPEGIVGRISDVTLHTSDVMLITDPNSRVACELELPASEGVGVVRGILYGGGVRPGADPKATLLYVIEPMRLRYLAREFEPAPRTRVVTSGLGQTFPKGLTVGYLLDSRMESNNLSREAEIMPAADMAGLHDVFILSARGVNAP